MKEILDEMKSNSMLIEENDFDELFDKAWQNIQTSFTKLEVEQYYQCDMDDNYNNFLNGNYDELVNAYKNFSKDWPSVFEEKPNIKAKRLHLITIPITKYISYEMYFYLMNEKAGEKIKCLDFNNTEYVLGEIDDFIIFDDNVVIINCHNRNGEYLKSYYYTESKNLILKLLKKYNEIYEKGKDYRGYSKFDFKLLNEMRLNDLI